MTNGQIKQIIADYNYGNGLSNMQLGKRYGVTNGTIRNILIRHGVYKPQRNVTKQSFKPERSAAWKLTHAERILRQLINWFEDEESNIKAIYTDAKEYFRINQKQTEL